MHAYQDNVGPALSGLTEREAGERLRSEGYNELPGMQRRGFGTIALEVVREPLFGLLIVAGGIYLAVGDTRETHDVDYALPGTLPETFHELVEFSVLASEVEPFDPMEQAFHRLARHYLANTEHLHHDWVLAHEYSLTPQLRAMSHVWRTSGRDAYVVAAKGAPEAIADLCHLDQAQMTALAAQVSALAERGLRVLAVARAGFRGSAWPAIQHDFEFEFLGLIGFADPVRAGVPQAIAECREAGIRVVMITGDYVGTAQAVARQAGLDCTAGVTGILWFEAFKRIGRTV